jgi:hypothetical protein
LYRLFEDAFDVTGLRYIGGDGDRCAACFPRYPFDSVLTAANQSDAGSFAGQSEGTCPANPAPGAGHNGDLVF